MPFDPPSRFDADPTTRADARRQPNVRRPIERLDACLSGTRAALLFLVTFVVEKYKQLAPPSIRKYGGRYLVRGGEVQALEGKWLPTRFVILQFDSVDQAKAWWNSPEYREAKLLRQASARTAMICVPGHDEL